MWSPKKARGRKGPHANVAPVAFRAASGDLLGNYTPKVAVFAHPTDAAGTKGDFEGESTSIEASFDFTPPVAKDPHVRPFWGAHHISRETPPGQASVAVGLGCPWDPRPP